MYKIIRRGNRPKRHCHMRDENKRVFDENIIANPLCIFFNIKFEVCKVQLVIHIKKKIDQNLKKKLQLGLNLVLLQTPTLPAPHEPKIFLIWSYPKAPDEITFGRSRI